MDFKDILLKHSFSCVDKEYLFAIYQSIQSYSNLLHADLQTLNDCVRNLTTEIRSPKSFLDEWKQPLATLSGAAVGAFLAFLFNWWIHLWKEKYEKKKQDIRQWNNFNTALVALEETRVGYFLLKLNS